ncbi:MAG: redox-sensing transcriptional repressor Rex, partial [Oscillospiraceae bacterium]|nr:redox-sensing transcriptional repressor Rex [Oscillospiraceae bacterium]
QDLSCFGEFGQPGYGYNVARLSAEIAHILGAYRSYSIILVGTGRIGQSLIENINFSRLGFRLLGAFDIRTELIGRQIGEITVQDAAMVHEFIRENGVDIAILSTNRDQAQSVAEGLIASGIHAIWNFTEMELDPGQSGVVVKGIHFSDSLLELSYFLSEAN